MSLTSYRAAPPRVGVCVLDWFGRPGGDRLSRALRRSIMGAGGFHVRVRDGIGCCHSAMATRSSDPWGWTVTGSGVFECVACDYAERDGAAVLPAGVILAGVGWGW